MTSKQVLRKTIVAVSAATMVALATPGVASAVDVTPRDEKGTAGQQSDLTGMPAKAKLKVHKLTPSTGKDTPKADGTAVTDMSKLPGSQPIQGVTFKAYKFADVDLTTNEGWRIANQLVEKWNELPESDKKTSDGLTLNGKKYALPAVASPTFSGKTGPDGVYESPEEDPGLYVVRESIDTATVNVGEGDANPRTMVETPAGAIVQGSPFVVALPLTNPKDRTKWMDVVNVYPKNSKSGVTKKVEDAVAHATGNTEDGNIAQSTVRYTIDADIPAGYKMPLSEEDKPAKADKKAKRFRNFQLVDRFHEKVNYKGGDVVRLISDADESKTKALTLNTDYTLKWDPEGTTPDGKAHIKTAVVTLTSAGLKQMALFSEKYPNGSNKVQWSLDATFGAITESGTFENDTYVIPDWPSNGGENPWKPTDDLPPNLPHGEVVSKYGKFTLHKISSADSSKNLKDAEFKLWMCDKSGTTLSGPVSVDNKTVFKTGDDGTFSLVGLRLNDFINGKKVGEGKTPATEYYCLEETKAPEGYEKLPNMIQFQLLEENNAQTKTLDVKNVPANGGFDLPLTGGNGVFPLIALGGLLVAGSAGYAAYASRRKNARA